MRSIFNFLVLAAVVAGLIFVAAPWFAFRGLREAARTNDAAGLSDLIDYNAVRKDLAEQIQPTSEPASPPPDIWHDPLGALKRAIQPMTQPTPATDAYLTSKALRALTNGRPPAAGPGAHAPFPMVRYWGPSHTRIAVRDKGEPNEAVFTFERRGFFAWKLVRLSLPEKPVQPRTEAPAASGQPAH
jgi:hypothetical protein